MAERSTLNTITQIGAETVPGTPVTAGKRFQGINFNPAIQANIYTFRPEGRKFPTIASLGKEWVEARFSGKPIYAELCYIFSGLFKAVTPTQIATSQYWKWVFSPSMTDLDTPKTFTVEVGSPERAMKFAYGLFSDFNFNFNRDAVDIDGRIIGNALTDGVSLSSASDIDNIVVFPTALTVYLDDTGASLGSTKFGNAISGSFNITDRWGLFWAVDSSLTSFKNYVERPPTGKVTLKFEADSQAMGLLNTLRAGSSKFVRIKTPAAIGAQDYLLCLDACLKITGVNAFEDADGIYAISFTGDIAYDSTWGKAVEATVQAKLSAL